MQYPIMGRNMKRLAGRFGAWVLALLMALACGTAAAAEHERDALIFASGLGSNDIVAIDTRTDRIAKRYDLPARPARSLVAGDLGWLVTVSDAPAAIHISNIDTGSLIESIDPGFEVSVVRLSADGTTLAAIGPGKISFIDLATAKIARKQQFDGTPSTVVFDRDGNVLLIGDAVRSRIHIVDVRQSGKVDVLDLSSPGAAERGIGHLARTPGGSTAMAIDGAGVGTILDLDKRIAVKRISLPGRQNRIYPTVNSQYFLVPNHGDASVSIISTWTHAESERLRMQGDISELNTVLADTVLFAFNSDTNNVEVFDMDHRRRHKDILLSGRPAATMVGPGGLKVYVALQGKERIAVIDVRTLKVIRNIEKIGFLPTLLFDSGILSYCH